MRRVCFVVLLASACFELRAQESDELQKLQAMLEAMDSQKKASDLLLQATRLHCVFQQGSTASWVDGNPVVEFDIMTKSGDPTVFYAIDLKGGSAQMMGNGGSQLVAAIATGSGLTFLESTPSGNVNVTTVFAGLAENSDKFLAVHSRHFFAMGQARPSQYHGTCSVPE